MHQHTLRHYFQSRRSYLVAKRATDVLLSVLVLLGVFPWLFPLAVVLIKMDSKGPVFFRQRRVGFLGKTFCCLKFRTMYVNAAADSKQAAKNDPRVTHIGRFLRYSGLDELPQFINVLRGDMSIVGPRPHMLQDSRHFSDLVENYKFRHMARPGITGMSQIRGCRGPAGTFEQIFARYQWDVYYICNISFVLDLKIMAATGSLLLISLFQKAGHAEEGALYGQNNIANTKRIA